MIKAVVVSVWLLILCCLVRWAYLSASRFAESGRPSELIPLALSILSIIGACACALYFSYRTLAEHLAPQEES